MEQSFMRVSLNSSKPPITFRSKNHSVNVTSTGPINSWESNAIVQDILREKMPKRSENKIALDTSKSDVFILRGENAQSAKISQESCDTLRHSDEEKHNLTQILLQPKKAKRQAAIYFDGTSLEGKKLSVVNIDKSQKGRIKVRIKALDVMA